MLLALSLIFGVLAADVPHHPLPDPYPESLAYHQQILAGLHQQRESIDAFIDVWGTDFSAVTNMQNAVTRTWGDVKASHALGASFEAARDAVTHAKFRLEAMQEAHTPVDLQGLRQAWLAPIRRAEEVLDRCREVAALERHWGEVQAEDLAQERRDLLQWHDKLERQVVALIEEHHAPRLARRALASLKAFAEAHPQAVGGPSPIPAMEKRVEASTAREVEEAAWRSTAAWNESGRWPQSDDAEDEAAVCVPWAMQLLDARPEVAHEESFIAFMRQCRRAVAPRPMFGAYPWPLSFTSYFITEMEQDAGIYIWAPQEGPSSGPSFTQAEIDDFNNERNREAFQEEAQGPRYRPPGPNDASKRREAEQKEARKREEGRCRAIDQASKRMHDQAVRGWKGHNNILKKRDGERLKAESKATKRARQETARGLNKAEKKAYERANHQLDNAWKKQKKSDEKTLKRYERDIGQGYEALHQRHNNVRRSMTALSGQADAHRRQLNAVHDHAAREVDAQRSRVARHVPRAPLAEPLSEASLTLGSRPTVLPGFAPVQTPLGQPFAIPAGTAAWTDLVATTDQYAEAQARIEHLSQRPLRQDMVDISALMIHRADAQFSDNDALSGHEMLSQARLVLDAAVDIGLAVALPQVAIAKSVVQMVTGKNLITGQPLSDWDQGWEAVNVLCLGHAQHIARTSRWLMRWAQADGASSRAAARVLEYWKAADQAARLERVSRQDAKLFGQTTYQGVMDGTYIGAAYSSVIMETVGELSATERAIAREFGGLQGVLAWRDPKVQEVAARWGTSWEGQNQLAVHLFRSHDDTIALRLKRLSSTEKSAGLAEGRLSRVLDDLDSQAIVDAYLDFNEIAESIKTKALPQNYAKNKRSEIWWAELATEVHPKSKGLSVKAYDKKTQTILSYSVRGWEKTLKNFQGE